MRLGNESFLFVYSLHLSCSTVASAAHAAEAAAAREAHTEETDRLRGEIEDLRTERDAARDKVRVR